MDEITQSVVVKLLVDRIVEFLRRSEKIPAIKWLRERLHNTKGITFGLKEAKDVVDVVAARLDAGTLGEDK